MSCDCNVTHIYAFLVFQGTSLECIAITITTIIYHYLTSSAKKKHYIQQQFC